MPRPHTPGAIVGVRVQWGEAGLAARIKAAGGSWDREAKIWRMSYGKAVELAVTDRLVPLPDERSRAGRKVAGKPRKLPSNG